MTSALRLCTKCGSEIPADAPEGGCPGCLLESGLGLFADAAVAGFDDRGHVDKLDSKKAARFVAILGEFGDYEIARREDGSFWELGRGGMGVTYRARDTVLHRSVALKVIEVPPEAGNSEVIRERFLREARAAAALRHPNVAAVYHFGTVPEPDRCYYAMELVEGETLEARVRREGPLKVAQVLEIGVQVTRALIAAANQGLIHRDLKPANIMLTRSEDSSAGFEVKVIDFGLAKVTAESFGERDLTHGGFVGTPSYASPEQFAGSRVDVRSDIYSLGASLWFALTGRLPCAGTNVEEIRRCQTEAPLPVQQLVTRKVPALVIELLRSMLAIDPDERPASARELMEGIENCRSKLTRGNETTRPSFFAELKRRNVYKVAIAYGVVAWLLMQVASQIFPFFEIPSWAVRLVVLLLIIGFPVAVILAWAFELTPEGIKREEDLDPGSSVMRKTGRKLDFFIIAVLVLVIGLLLFQRLHHNVPPAVSSSPEKSIAVLPFENLSRDPANAYFADGIQDEILTRLSKIADLKVISRTSTQHYKSAPENLPEIAKQLGVANILQGRVQKSGDAVRVNVQLIRAANDSHLWADTFDRKLTDIFSVESEVAKVIAEQLRAHLTGQEERVIAAKPTDNPQAYDAYLRGLAYSLKPADTPANSLGAQKYLREAVRLDPKFALAWALLSYVESAGYRQQNLEPTVALREEARQAAETALALQPNLGEAILAKGYYHYALLKDYDTAVHYFEQARQLLPSSSRIPEQLAYVARRRGQWDKSESYFNEAERLDPRNVQLLTQHALSYIDLRRFPEALRKLDQVLNITPDDVDTLAFKAGIAQAEGDLPRAAALLAPLHPNADAPFALETQVYQAILERQPAPMIGRLKEILAKSDPALVYINGNLRFWLGWAQEVASDHAAAQDTWRQARSELEPFLNEQPDNYGLIGDLALTNMGLGEKAAALALTERAMAANPIEKDPMDGPTSIEILARVSAKMGEPDRAIAALQKLLSIPYKGAFGEAPLTPALLRLDPMFDPLRNDPRFQKLCEEKQPVAPEVLTQSAPEKSIAVLPFENLSSDPDNAYFADGTQNEILTKLAGIGDLKVISRTSSAKYKNKPENLKTVARELGVATVLEGSVQRAGGKVRINVQLVDARNDTHLWAKSYDRDLKDVFAVESDVAQEIAETLRAKLSPSQSIALAAAPTRDTEAYDLFLKGEYQERQAESTYKGETYDRAATFYRQALRRDPSFSLAYARLAYNRLYRHWYVGRLTSAQLEEVKSNVERALAIAPDSPEAHLAMGIFHYWGRHDFDTALREFDRAIELQPNNSDTISFRAAIYRRRGEWRRALAEFERAMELDPHAAWMSDAIGSTYLDLRRWSEAEHWLKHALALDPHHLGAAFRLSQTYIASTGDIQRARRAWEGIPTEKAVVTVGAYEIVISEMIDNRVYLDVLERHFSDALKEWDAAPDNTVEGRLTQLKARIGIQVLAGQNAAAKRECEEARVLLEAQLAQRRSEDSTSFSELAWIYVCLGRNDDALRLAREAAEAMPIEKDAVLGANFLVGLAQIEAHTGQPEAAVKLLRQLLTIPAGEFISVARLKIDPVWDPIRNDPGFQKLLSDPEPATVYK